MIDIKFTKLSEIYIELCMKKVRVIVILLKKSLGNFRRTMVVVEKHFPADSTHIKRIKSKIASFDNKY